jgi:hypothetical protein
MPETLTIDMFAARVGERFRLRVQPERSLDLELIEVTPLRVRSANGHDAQRASVRREPFSLVFRGPANLIAPQRMYPVEHDAMGSHDLFLVPIGPDHAGMRYEAVFT